MHVLTANEQAKVCYALEDISVAIFEDPRKFTLEDLPQIQTILASRNLQLAPIPRATGLPAPEPVEPAAATATAAPVLSPQERYAIESTYLPSLKAMASKDGFVYKLPQMKYALILLCRLAGIPFPR